MVAAVVTPPVSESEVLTTSSIFPSLEPDTEQWLQASSIAVHYSLLKIYVFHSIHAALVTETGRNEMRLERKDDEWKWIGRRYSGRKRGERRRGITREKRKERSREGR